jgi:hypothetical protein
MFHINYMVKKEFFQERSVASITSSSNTKEVYNPRSLVDHLFSGDESNYLMRANIVPTNYSSGKKRDIDVSRNYEFRGPTLPINSPNTMRECAIYQKGIRNLFKDSASETSDFTNPYQNNFLGYHFQPNWSDRMRRTVFFSDLMEGALLYLYSNMFSPIEVVDNFSGRGGEENRGAEIVVSVPSRERKKDRYRFKLQHVPFHQRSNNLGVSLLFKTNAAREEGFTRPGNDNWRFRYKAGNPLENPERIVFLPQDVAAYIALAKKQCDDGNCLPMKFSPFLIPSREMLEFYLRLRDNCLILDAHSRRKEYRHLHQQEKSRLVSILIGKRIRDFETIFPNTIDEKNYSSLFEEN